MYRSSLMSASSVFDLDQCLLLVMSAFQPVTRGAGVLKGGHDYAKRQQRRQPDRQLVGRNELDDGSSSDCTGPCMAIRLVTRALTFCRPVSSARKAPRYVAEFARSAPFHPHR